MLTGLEFVIALAAVAAGIAMFVIALRKRPVGVVAISADSGTAGILKSNFLALTVIALIFFGAAFLVDVFS